LQDAGREHLLDRKVFYIRDIVGFRLRYRLLDDCIGIESCHLQREAQVLLHLFGDCVQVGDTGPELPQRHVLDVLRPDHGESADRIASGRHAGGSGSRLRQQGTASDTTISDGGHHGCSWWWHVGRSEWRANRQPDVPAPGENICTLCAMP
jgi:hypothetical protein